MKKLIKKIQTLFRRLHPKKTCCAPFTLPDGKEVHVGDTYIISEDGSTQVAPTAAAIAYYAYCKNPNQRSADNGANTALPPFSDLNPLIIAKWQAAALAVLDSDWAKRR